MKRYRPFVLLAGVAGAFCLASCTRNNTMNNTDSGAAVIVHDVHSYSNPQQVRVKHVSLDLAVLFDRKVLRGTATLDIERTAQGGSAPLILDTDGLNIEKAETSGHDIPFRETSFKLGKRDPILGTPLTVKLPSDATRVRITYSTSPDASGLQWCTPAQTAGKKQPFLYSQSEAIHARSWIPLQDSPGVRVTYTAHIHTPKDLVAVMSAERDPASPDNGDYLFRMPEAIPSYLIAIAVGDLAFRPTGERSGVWAEPSVVESAAKEFEDTEKMIEAATELYGPYRWGRYDILVLPPSFPFGGMENPRLTFATPTVLAGDKSLVSLVAHELAHSWSGNLVSNATWSDFWLNEGFTTYIEWRIQEKLYGRERADMETLLGIRSLRDEMAGMDPRDEVLHVDLAGRNPDDGMTQVPYIKGALFLRTLEEAYGRSRFDAFVRGYFDHFAFQSITTKQFLDYLNRNLLNSDPAVASRIPLEQWVYQAGLPSTISLPSSPAFDLVQNDADQYVRGELKPAAIPYSKWNTQERLHFLDSLPINIGAQRMAELDRAFHFTATGNNEILAKWLLAAARNQYQPADQRLDQFLVEVGRLKYIKPLYQELVKTPHGKAEAERVFEKARPGYHPITVASIEQVLKGAGG